MPESLRGEGAEDLYVFHAGEITLRKGERMVFSVAEFTVPYENVYVLNLAAAPPAAAWRSMNRGQRDELAQQLANPVVMHRVRLQNDSEHPFTTAPALLFLDGQVLSQGMMTYAPRGGTVDLDVTAAVNITHSLRENETERTPLPERWRGTQLVRVDLEGEITLANLSGAPLTVEVTRHVLGNVTEVGQEGRQLRVSLMGEVGGPGGGSGNLPRWWSSWSSPDWWAHFNGISRIDWSPSFEPGERVTLSYSWHYVWN